MPDLLRVKEIFADALELAPGESAWFLDRSCGGDVALREQVVALLAAHDGAAQFLATPTIGPASAARAAEVDEEAPGVAIGCYRLIERIGEGGFGSVWRAEQVEPLRREVALKLVKLGMDTREVLARFDAERQALARMEHAAIARVFDAGATRSGRPYFVMELVRGVPITRFCDDERLALAERLRVFVEVCRAVQHAHQKGVIHRDLKPSNVLVARQDERNVPKVIDFGIAKATRADAGRDTLLTERGQILGTPEYMAPEQAEAGEDNVDTRADVYSLGVLLYELLTGTRPFDGALLARKGMLELLLHIRGVDPQRPSTRVSTLGADLHAVAERRALAPHQLIRAVRGDLDWIVMKAIEKDRERRYASASDLAADVERFLNREPVSAMPPSRRYVLAKWVRRNRVAVVSGAVVLVALVTGLVLAVVGYLEASDARDAAQTSADEAVIARDAARTSEVTAIEQRNSATQQAERARRVTKFVTKMLGEASPETTSQGEATVRSLLDQARTELDGGAQVDPEIEATLRFTIGEAYRALGRLDEAQTLIEAAEKLRRERLDPRSLDMAKLLNQLGVLRRQQDRPDEAVRCFVELESIARDLGDMDLVYQAMENRAGLYARLGRAGEVPEILEEVLAGREALLGPDHIQTQATRGNLGAALSTLGRFAEARPLLEQAYASSVRQLGPRNQRTRQLLRALASHKLQVGAERDVVDLLREQLVIERELYPRLNPELLQTLESLAVIDTRAGRYPQAEAELRELVAGQRALHGESFFGLGDALLQLGQVLANTNRAAEAEVEQRRALSIFESQPTVPWSRVAMTHGELARTLVALQHYDEAQREAELAVSLGTDAYGREHPQVLTFKTLLGLVLYRKGDFDASALIVRKILDARIRVLGPEHIEVAETHFNLAMIEKASGRLSEALDGVLAVAPKFLDVNGWPHPRSHACFDEIADLSDKVFAAGDREGARRAWSALLDLAQDARVESDDWRRRAEDGLARLGR